MILDLHEVLEDDEEVPTFGVVFFSFAMIFLTIGLAYIIFLCSISLLKLI